MTKTLQPVWDGATYTLTIDGVGLEKRPITIKDIPHNAPYRINDKNELEIVFSDTYTYVHKAEPDAAHKGNAT